MIDLAKAGPGNPVAKRGFAVELAWFFVEACVISNKLMPVSSLRVALLRAFGARTARHCRMPHPMRVKAPWNLEVGDNCWFGVDAWIYNQTTIRIGSNVCVSQGAFLTTGIARCRQATWTCGVAPIVIEDGVWITSKCGGADGRDDRALGPRHAAVSGRASLARAGRRVRRESGALHQKALSRMSPCSARASSDARGGIGPAARTGRRFQFRHHGRH